MNLRQTAEVAAIVATSAAHIVESRNPIPTESLHAFWKQSRTRLKCWFAFLQTSRMVRTDVSREPTQLHRTGLVTLCREILVTEMLTRVWSTVLIASDQRRNVTQTRAAVDAVFRGHQEARHEVLQLLADDTALAPDEQLGLDRFRRRIERWTDALIGPLQAAYGVDEFAFDTRRSQEFAESALQARLQGAADAQAPLLLAGVTATFPRSTDADREREMLNLSIVRAILAAYPPDAFGRDGRLKSSSHARVDRSSRHSDSPSQAENSGNRAPDTLGLSFIKLRQREARDPGSRN